MSTPKDNATIRCQKRKTVEAGGGHYSKNSPYNPSPATKSGKKEQEEEHAKIRMKVRSELVVASEEAKEKLREKGWKEVLTLLWRGRGGRLRKRHW